MEKLRPILLGKHSDDGAAFPFPLPPVTFKPFLAPSECFYQGPERQKKILLYDPELAGGEKDTILLLTARREG